MNQQTLRIIEIILSVLGIVAILLQNRNESGSAFVGGGGEGFKVRRGLDRFLFYATIVIIISLVVVVYFDITA